MTDLDDLDTPNCPRDLVAMEAVGDGESARWQCPECGLIALISPGLHSPVSRFGEES